MRSPEALARAIRPVYFARSRRGRVANLEVLGEEHQVSRRHIPAHHLPTTEEQNDGLRDANARTSVERSSPAARRRALTPAFIACGVTVRELLRYRMLQPVGLDHADGGKASAADETSSLAPRRVWREAFVIFGDATVEMMPWALAAAPIMRLSSGFIQMRTTMSTTTEMQVFPTSGRPAVTATSCQATNIATRR